MSTKNPTLEFFLELQDDPLDKKIITLISNDDEEKIIRKLIDSEKKNS